MTILLDLALNGDIAFIFIAAAFLLAAALIIWLVYDQWTTGEENF